MWVGGARVAGVEAEVWRLLAAERVEAAGRRGVGRRGCWVLGEGSRVGVVEVVGGWGVRAAVAVGGRSRFAAGVAGGERGHRRHCRALRCVEQRCSAGERPCVDWWAQEWVGYCGRSEFLVAVV